MQWIAVDQERGLAVVERERRREVARNEAATAARLYRCDQGDEITVLAERQQLGAQAAEGIGLAAHGIVAMDQLAILERTRRQRSEEHTSELQSLMRISYAVFCLKKKKNTLQYAHKARATQTTNK